MKREQLEHVIRASSRICVEPVFVVIGSQAILGTHPDTLEAALVRSVEADLYPLYAPAKSDLLNAIGWGSEFHNTYGYYVDGVDDSTATLPEGWIDRVRAVDVELTDGAMARGLCLEPHDLAVSKLAAGREKDIEYVSAAARCGYLRKELLLERLERTSLRRTLRARIGNHVQAIFGADCAG